MVREKHSLAGNFVRYFPSQLEVFAVIFEAEFR